MSARRRQLGLTLIEAFAILMVVMFIAAILFPLTACAKCTSARIACLSNTKQVGLAVVMYAEDHDRSLPVADNWMDAIQHYLRYPDLLHDADLQKKSDYGRALRQSAAGRSESDFQDPSKFVMLFDSNLMQRNASSELWSLPKPGRHKGWDDLVWVDGHAKGVNMDYDSAPFRKILLEDGKAGALR